MVLLSLSRTTNIEQRRSDSQCPAVVVATWLGGHSGWTRSLVKSNAGIWPRVGVITRLCGIRVGDEILGKHGENEPPISQFTTDA